MYQYEADKKHRYQYMTQNLDTYAFFVYNNTSHSYKILTVWISRYNDILEDVLGTLYARYLNVLQLG